MIKCSYCGKPITKGVMSPTIDKKRRNQCFECAREWMDSKLTGNAEIIKNSDEVVNKWVSEGLDVKKPVIDATPTFTDKDLTNTPNRQSEWEYKWELRLNLLMGEKLYQGVTTDFTVTNIKDLIRNILSDTRQKLKEQVEGLKQPLRTKYPGWASASDYYKERAYNAAIQDVIKLLGE